MATPEVISPLIPLSVNTVIECLPHHECSDHTSAVNMATPEVITPLSMFNPLIMPPIELTDLDLPNTQYLIDMSASDINIDVMFNTSSFTSSLSSEHTDISPVLENAIDMSISAIALTNPVIGSTLLSEPRFLTSSPTEQVRIDICLPNTQILRAMCESDIDFDVLFSASCVTEPGNVRLLDVSLEDLDVDMLLNDVLLNPTAEIGCCELSNLELSALSLDSIEFDNIDDVIPYVTHSFTNLSNIDVVNDIPRVSLFSCPSEDDNTLTLASPIVWSPVLASDVNTVIHANPIDTQTRNSLITETDVIPNLPLDQICQYSPISSGSANHTLAILLSDDARASLPTPTKRKKIVPYSDSEDSTFSPKKLNDMHDDAACEQVMSGGGLKKQKCMPRFCRKCRKEFQNKDMYENHLDDVHRPYKCNFCPLKYATSYRKREHQNKQHRFDGIRCFTCNESFETHAHREQHENTNHVTPDIFPCRFCNRYFQCHVTRDRHEVHHKIKKHSPVVIATTEISNMPENVPIASSLETPPMHDANVDCQNACMHEDPPASKTHGSENLPARVNIVSSSQNREIESLISVNMDHIKDRVRPGTFRSEFTFRLNTVFNQELMREHILAIYSATDTAFKVNFSFSVIINNRLTNDVRFFYASNNSDVLDVPYTISSLNDIDKFIQRQNFQSIEETLTKVRPNSEWSFLRAVSVKYAVFRTAFALGAMETVPAFLNKKCMKHFAGMDDMKCVFRCVAYDRLRTNREALDTRRVERETRIIYKRWRDSAVQEEALRKSWHAKQQSGDKCVIGTKPPHVRSMDTIDLYDLYLLEEQEDITIRAFRMLDCGDVESVYKPLKKRSASMYINVYNNHASYISDINSYLQSYKCPNCGRLMKLGGMKRHTEVDCSEMSKLTFPGRMKPLSETVFHKLVAFGINVP